jgi:hypothetical protein
MSYLIVALLASTAVGLFLYTPGPGRRLRYRLSYAMTKSEWQKGKAVVGLRVLDGSHDGLGPGWRVGSAVVTPGRVEFTRFVGGTSLIKRPVAAVSVAAVGEVARISGTGRLRLDPDCQVARLTTPSAVLEMAVMPPIPAEQVLARMR